MAIEEALQVGTTFRYSGCTSVTDAGFVAGDLDSALMYVWQ